MLRKGIRAEVGLSTAQFWFPKQGSSLAPTGFWFGRFFGREVRGSILGPVLRFFGIRFGIRFGTVLGLKVSPRGSKRSPQCAGVLILAVGGLFAARFFLA